MEPSHSQNETPPLSSKESRMNRFKPIWRFFLISNLALGAYIFANPKKKNTSIANNKPAKEEEDSKSDAEAAVSSDAVTDALVHEEPPILPVVPKPALDPIPEDRQRELFKWILEEKRKAKPNDPGEKKRIDKEKAVLKQFLRVESLPRI